MFVRRGHRARSPKFADGLREGSDDLPQQALMSESNNSFLQRFLESTPVEPLHSRKAGIMKNLSRRNCTPGRACVSSAQLRFGDERFQPGEREFGDVSNAVSRRSRQSEKV